MRLSALRAGPVAARGMTLIELMIGLAIAAILLLLAAPAYRDFIANTNVRNAAENTVAGLRQAQRRGGEAQRGRSSSRWCRRVVDRRGRSETDGSVKRHRPTSSPKAPPRRRSTVSAAATP